MSNPRSRMIVIPRIRVILAMFEPITLDKERMGVLFKAEEMPTKSSGREVAMPAKIKAINKFGNF